jgi:Flp pilus assembly protein TadG
VITGWLVKIVVVIALLGFVAVELGSPLWTRAQLDSVAHDAADEAARVRANTNDIEQARRVAEEEADSEDARLTRFAVDNQGRVHVTVYRQARSYLLHRFGATEDWYDVSVDATAAPPSS